MNIATLFAPGSSLAGSQVTADTIIARLERHDWTVTGPDDADVLLGHVHAPETLRDTGRRHGLPIVVLARTGPEIAVLDPSSFDLVVWPSERQRRQGAWGGDQVVVRPPIFVDDYAAGRGPSNAITLVGLTAGHGASLFYEIATRMPDRRFLGVMSQRGPTVPWPALANLELVDRVDDMRDVYRETRLLLMPGEQTYGRPAIEAACSGIPTIAHPWSGTVDTLGNAGVWANHERVGDWLQAIRNLDDPAMYRLTSLAAFDRAVHLDPTADLARLEFRLLDLANARVRS